MSCVPTISVSGSPVSVTVPETVVPITVEGSAVVVETTETSITVSVPASSAVVVEMVERGLPGVDGDPDYVWPDRPDATPVYTGDFMTRINYSDGTYKVLTWNVSGQLVTVSGPNRDGATVTQTRTYDGEGRWSGTTTVVV